MQAIRQRLVCPPHERMSEMYKEGDLFYLFNVKASTQNVKCQRAIAEKGNSFNHINVFSGRRVQPKGIFCYVVK